MAKPPFPKELKVLRVVALTLAVFYLGVVAYKMTAPEFELPLAWLVKSVPIFLAAFMAFRRAPGKLTNRVAIGLVFSGFGDIVLALGREDLFVLGLGLFLIAHIWYIAAFATQFRVMKHKFFYGIPIFGTGIGIYYWLYPNIAAIDNGALVIPVAVYIFVIATMTFLAALRTIDDFRIVGGAVLFMLSDAMIAINKFKFEGDLYWAHLFIMVTYYGAQLLIAWGAVRAQRRLDSPHAVFYN